MGEEFKKYDKKKLTIERYKRKMNPLVIGAILEDTHELNVKTHIEYLKVMMILNDVVRKIMDNRGVTGMQRTVYYDYSKTLWKCLSKYPEQTWEKFINMGKTYYEKIHGAKPEILEEVTNDVVKVIKEILVKIK
jgi:DNA-binding transcriptional regulator GbsR (MarR family)